MKALRLATKGLLCGPTAEEIQGSGGFGAQRLTEDVPMREMVAASNLSVKAILNDRCFGRICVSSQSVRGDGGNACH